VSILAQFFGPVVAKILQITFVNSEVTEPIFTTFSNDVEALVLRSMHACTKRYCICFGTEEQRVKAVNFDFCKNDSKIN